MGYWNNSSESPQLRGWIGSSDNGVLVNAIGYYPENNPGFVSDQNNFENTLLSSYNHIGFSKIFQNMDPSMLIRGGGSFFKIPQLFPYLGTGWVASKHLNPLPLYSLSHVSPQYHTWTGSYNQALPSQNWGVARFDITINTSGVFQKQWQAGNCALAIKYDSHAEGRKLPLRHDRDHKWTVGYGMWNYGYYIEANNSALRFDINCSTGPTFRTWYEDSLETLSFIAIYGNNNYIYININSWNAYSDEDGGRGDENFNIFNIVGSNNMIIINVNNATPHSYIFSLTSYCQHLGSKVIVYGWDKVYNDRGMGTWSMTHASCVSWWNVDNEDRQPRGLTNFNYDYGWDNKNRHSTPPFLPIR